METDNFRESNKLCTLCPRMCGKNRAEGESGFCRVTGEGIYLSRAALHFWEEPCISMQSGSGTVFFSGCNLSCIYCQNRDISTAKVGQLVSVDRLAEIFLELSEKGAANINLVTPTHYAIEIREAVQKARAKGLALPIVYNTSGYERPETLHFLSDSVDIYLTDFKYMDENLARDFSHAEDYPHVTKEALREMVSEKGEARFDSDGRMLQGVIVRHLILPGHIRNSYKVLDYLFSEYENRIVYSLMNQYTPCFYSEKYPELNRKVTKREYEKVISYATNLGITNAYIQEGATAEESFIPDFNYEGL